MTGGRLVATAGTLGLWLSVLSAILPAGVDDAKRYVDHLDSEVRLLLEVAGPAPEPLKQVLLAAFQKRILEDRARFASWDAAAKDRIYERYERVWAAFRGQGGSAPAAEGLLPRHAEIRQALGKIGGPDVLKALVDRLDKGEPIGAVLADGVRQLESIDYRADSAAAENPVVARFYSSAARWVADWKADREAKQTLADLDLLGRCAARVPPSEAALDQALFGLADRVAQACLAADGSSVDAFRSLNPLIDAIRASGIVRTPGGIDGRVKARFSFVPRRVDRDGLVMDFEVPDLAGRRSDVVEVKGAALEAVQYFDPDRRAWIEPEVAAGSRHRDAPVFYLLPNRTLRLRYRLESTPAGEDVPDSVWLVQAERVGPNTACEVLLPRSAVRRAFYHLTLKQRAYWVFGQCWSQADVLKRLKAHLERLGDEERNRVRAAFFVLWESAGGTPSGLDAAGLKDLFAKVEYDRSFESKPFRLDHSFSPEVRQALIELFNVEPNPLSPGGHAGEQLPDRQLARELLRTPSLVASGVTGLVDAGCQKTTLERDASGRSVGICTVIPLEKKGRDR